MANKIEISKFSSLNFLYQWRLDFEMDKKYFQKFGTNDIITLQFFVPKGITMKSSIYNLITKDT